MQRNGKEGARVPQGVREESGSEGARRVQVSGKATPWGRLQDRMPRSVPPLALRMLPGPRRVSLPCALGVLPAALRRLPPFPWGEDERAEPRRQPGAPGMLSSCRARGGG